MKGRYLEFSLFGRELIPGRLRGLGLEEQAAHTSVKSGKYLAKEGGTLGMKRARAVPTVRLS